MPLDSSLKIIEFFCFLRSSRTGFVYEPFLNFHFFLDFAHSLFILQDYIVSNSFNSEADFKFGLFFNSSLTPRMQVLDARCFCFLKIRELRTAVTSQSFQGDRIPSVTSDKKKRREVQHQFLLICNHMLIVRASAWMKAETSFTNPNPLHHERVAPYNRHAAGQRINHLRENAHVPELLRRSRFQRNRVHVHIIGIPRCFRVFCRVVLILFARAQFLGARRCTLRSVLLLLLCLSRSRVSRIKFVLLFEKIRFVDAFCWHGTVSNHGIRSCLPEL